MDFILNNSGLLFGIGLVAVFAIIGYFADKKDNSNKNVNVNDRPIKSNYVPSDLGDSGDSTNDFGEYDKIVSELDSSDSSEQFKFDNNVFYPNSGSTGLDNGVDINATSSTNVETNNGFNDTDISNGINNFQSDTVSSENLGTNINNIQSETDSRIDSFAASDFESLDISLEDLEKKNFNDVLNNRNVNDDENFYYSNIEDSNSYSDDLELPDTNVSDVSSFNFSVDDNQNDISNQVENSGENSIDAEEQGASDYNHLFDGETQSSLESNSDGSNDSKSEKIESADEVDNSYDSENENFDSVPELFGDSANYDSINNNDSSDDEIWKF